MLTFRRNSQSKDCSHLQFSVSLAIPLTEDRGLWLRDDINILHQIPQLTEDCLASCTTWQIMLFNSALTGHVVRSLHQVSIA